VGYKGGSNVEKILEALQGISNKLDIVNDKASNILDKLDQDDCVVVTSQNITLSNESDINKIARELHKSIQRDSRSRGI
jgi:hypothetical protein